MRLDVYDRVDDFLAAASDFLAAREAEHNLLFGICATIRATPDLFAADPPRFAAVFDDTGRTLAATLRTPPHNAVLSEIDDLVALEPLVNHYVERDPGAPGVLGPKEAARRFAELWHERTGRAGHVQVSERIYRLSRVIPPPPTPGSWRVAEGKDHALLVDWLDAFAREATPDAPEPRDLGAMVDRWIRGIGRTLYLWEDDGTVVSMVGAGGETPNGIRIGPVYTPTGLRRRGYASSLTAAASQDELDKGRRFCFLFTNLANPTSNKIYQAIGYEPVTDVDQYAFEPG